MRPRLAYDNDVAIAITLPVWMEVGSEGQYPAFAGSSSGRFKGHHVRCEIFCFI